MENTWLGGYPNYTPPVVEENTDFQGEVIIPPVTKMTGYESGMFKIFNEESKDPVKQSCGWYNIPCKIAEKTSMVGDFIQSTLLKVIILLVVVAISYVFLLSYIQAKAGRLA